MARRTKLWKAAGALFVGINVAGGIYAVVVGEPMHVVIHAVLLAVGAGAYYMFRFRAANRPALPRETVERLQHLEQSVDALAIGVERIGEAQRYQVKILDEKAKASAGGKEDS